MRSRRKPGISSAFRVHGCERIDVTLLPDGVYRIEPKQLSADEELCRQYVGVTASGGIGAAGQRGH